MIYMSFHDNNNNCTLVFHVHFKLKINIYTHKCVDLNKRLYFPDQGPLHNQLVTAERKRRQPRTCSSQFLITLSTNWLTCKNHNKEFVNTREAQASLRNDTGKYMILLEQKGRSRGNLYLQTDVEHWTLMIRYCKRESERQFVRCEKGKKSIQRWG